MIVPATAIQRNALSDRRAFVTDSIVILGAMAMGSGILASLVFGKPDPSVTPILSSAFTLVMALPGGYAAFRWGNSVGAKQASDAASEHMANSQVTIRPELSVTPASNPASDPEPAPAPAPAPNPLPDDSNPQPKE